MEALFLLLLSALLAGTAAVPRQAGEGTPLDDRSLPKRVGGLNGKVIRFWDEGFRGRATGLVCGQKANKGQFPYQAAILPDRSHFCEGSVLSKSWILTAGHCIMKYSRWTVIVGITYLRDSGPNRVLVSSREAYFYPGYQGPTDRDIGVIKLIKELTYTDTIQPTKLPTRAEANQDLVGKRGRLSVWKYTTGPDAEIAFNLRWAYQTLIRNEDCAKRYGLDGKFIKDYLVCSFDEDSQNNLCEADYGGGPFVLDEEGVQVGVLSFTAKPSDPKRGLPYGFTRTGSFLDWISNTTGVELQ